MGEQLETASVLKRKTKFIKFQEKTCDWFPFSIKSCCSKAEVLFRKKCSPKFRCLNLNVWMHRIYVYRIASGLLNSFLNLCFNPLLATASILYPLVFRCYLGVWSKSNDWKWVKVKSTTEAAIYKVPASVPW